MSADLGPVFRHCFGFPDKVKRAPDFADYILACQVETTMPFNDYWHGAPPLPSLSVPLLIAVFVGVLAVVGVALYFLFDALGWAESPELSWAFAGEVLLLAELGAGPASYAIYRLIMTRGLKRFPAAPNSDLPSVLKALYLQRQLIPVVAQMQGVSDQALYDAFGELFARVQVDNVMAPTQPPGVIG
jgi:hypothetical protein